MSLAQLLASRRCTMDLLLKGFVLLVFSLTVAFATFDDCAESLETLENALYDGKSNLLELHKVFFPPSSRPSRFTKVIYSFLNESKELDGCNITYIWAIGVFLFIQPPSLFRLTSLNFIYPNNNFPPISLQLPHACRDLVMTSPDGECSCEGNHALLDILTQQVCLQLAIVNLGL